MTDEATDTIGKRAKQVRLEAKKTQVQMAEFLGLATATWQKIERDEGLPSGETLVQFEKLGINPGWILSGLGPKKLNAKPLPTSEDLSVYAGFLREIAEAVRTEYIENSARLNSNDIIQVSAHWFLEVQKMAHNIGDIEELRSLLPWIRTQVKKEIADANAGLGKRAASD